MRVFRFARRSFAVVITIILSLSVYWSYQFSVSNPRTLHNKPLLAQQTSMLRTWEAKANGLHKHYTDAKIIKEAQPTPQEFAKITKLFETSTQGSRAITSSTDLLSTLLQIELDMNPSLHEPKALFIGSETLTKLVLPLYQPVLENMGYQVDFQLGKNLLPDSSWTVLWCLTLDKETKCLNADGYSQLKHFQKVSQFPGVSKILLRPEDFCYMMLASKHIQVLQNSPISLPCYVLPSQKKSLLIELANTAKNDSYFFVRRLGAFPQGHIKFIGSTNFLKRYIDQQVVIQIEPHGTVSVSGVPLVIKVCVLLTSLSPLRVYRHKDRDAIVMSNYKGIKETWTFQQLSQFLTSGHYSEHDIDELWRRVDKLIVNTLLLTESSLHSTTHKGEHTFGKQNYFQLLQFHVVIDNTLRPFVSDVSDGSDGSIPHTVASDTVQLLLGRTSVAQQVHDMLSQLSHIIGIQGPGCVTSHQVCLSPEELRYVYVMESEREAAHMGGFYKLYPAPDGHKYTPLITELQASAKYLSNIPHGRGTPQMHSMLTRLERHRLNGAQAPTIAEQTLDARRGYLQTGDEDDTEHAQLTELQDIPTKEPECDNDPEASPVLTALYTEPSVQLQPAFRHDIESYRVTVPFSVMTIRVWGKTSTCSSEVRVNSYTETAPPANYSLGVGWNTYAVHLVDKSHGDKAWVLTSYQLHIYRQLRSEHAGPFRKTLPHVVCSLVQDCDMRVFTGQPCGLQGMEKDWDEFVKKRAELPICNVGYEPGRWVVPCGKCRTSESCHWQKAVWAPYHCKHETLSKDQVKACLANKKVLFVGDSTNRGIMYYLMEKMNGSLRHWEKTHTMKIYSGALNDDRTSVSFAYYPQFWLDKKPVFVKALYHLIARFMPLENSTNTILVVGGVQWMLPSHVTAIKHALTSLGLSGIQVVIKGLGSGFHLPVAGFVKLDMEGQRKIAQRNSAVSKAAQSAGFEFVDTYNMTIARYKEFLYGKCGCHFHKVVNMNTDAATPEEDQGPLSVKDVAAEQDDAPRYHVLGPINAMYSEIAISRMCS